MISKTPEIEVRDFLIGGCASSVATLFTNPLEVIYSVQLLHFFLKLL